VGPPSLATPLSANSLAVANGRAPYTIAWSRGRDDLPVDQVDWTDANRFCAWARARLPTAEEWDRIVTNGGRTRFPWGDEPPSAKRANLCFRGCENRPGRPVEDDGFANESGPVCAYPDGRNADGVCDLVGNLTEWTSSPYPFHPGVSKQARGSSHNSYPDMAAPPFVHWFDADARGDNIGFRCVRTPIP
jgi:iron(II)-dependent oxidoreductase